MGRKRKGHDGIPDAVEMPIGPELDLHTFRPEEVASVVEEYLDAAVHKGIFEVRLIHGKGIGALRRTVHAVLDRHKAVGAYFQADHGNWGATVVKLHPRR